MLNLSTIIVLYISIFKFLDGNLEDKSLHRITASISDFTLFLIFS